MNYSLIADGGMEPLVFVQNRNQGILIRFDLLILRHVGYAIIFPDKRCFHGLDPHGSIGIEEPKNNPIIGNDLL